jgi:curved DNA-binding protein CbpA
MRSRPQSRGLSTAGEDLYALLDLDENATQEQIRKAYYRLAKIYHPDLQVEANQEATERFLQIQKAYGVLSVPARRSEYDIAHSGSKAGGAKTAPEPAEPSVESARKVSLEEERNARLAFMKAEELIEAGFVDKAIQLMDAVVRTIPDQAEYQSLYGYALALNGERLHRARDACRRALEADPHNPDFHAHLGYVYLRAGLKQTAQTCFQAALDMNPMHRVALQHFAAATKTGGGLFARLRALFGGA